MLRCALPLRQQGAAQQAGAHVRVKQHCHTPLRCLMLASRDSCAVLPPSRKQVPRHQGGGRGVPAPPAGAVCRLAVPRLPPRQQGKCTPSCCIVAWLGCQSIQHVLLGYRWRVSRLAVPSPATAAARLVGMLGLMNCQPASACMGSAHGYVQLRHHIITAPVWPHPSGHTPNRRLPSPLPAPRCKTCSSQWRT